MNKYQPVTATLFTIFLLFFVSGCSTTKNFSSFLPEIPFIQDEELGSQDVVEADKELEELEPLMCLDEELIELSKTGVWNDPPSPISIQEEGGIEFDFPVVINKQVEMYLNLIQNKQRKQFARWLARSGQYKSMIENELAEAGLPQDLLYLAMIESGFNPLACSRAKAVGLWQFMKGTGRQYNLKIDRYVDERRNPAKATRAAVNYLGDLYKEFGDWHLAVAAYNGGPGKVRSGLRRHKVDNFWDLASKRHLSLETKRYVPKLIATLLIAKEPERYGFYNITYKDPIEHDTITVGPGMSLHAVALVSGSNKKQIKNLNQELRQSKTPLNKSHYKVRIPKGSAALAQKNMKRLHSIVSTGYKTHKIRKNETLTRICRKYNINKTTLLKVNNLRSGQLVAGQRLRIPYSTVTYQLLPEGNADAMAAYKDSLVLHKIKRGDTIGRIAKKYNVPKQMIVTWNGLKNEHTIRAGQQLALYIDRGHPGSKSPSKPAVLASSKNKQKVSYPLIKAVASKRFVTAKVDGGFQYYSVKSGDSLWTISRKFSAKTSDIKRWNNLKSNLIHPGSTLKVKKG